MKVIVRPETFSIARLDPNADVPTLTGASWYSVVRTPKELSIVAPKGLLTKLGLMHEHEWACISFDQTFDLSLTGVAAAFTKPLAAAGIPVFIVNSYETDHILVPRHRCDESVGILEGLDIAMKHLHK